MALTPEELAKVTILRDLLGESVSDPEAPATGESIFTDEKLLGYIKDNPTMNHAALVGWNVKMAHFANLVNVTDGAAAREMSDLFEHARQMVRHYTGLGNARDRSRVGKIIRA